MPSLIAQFTKAKTACEVSNHAISYHFVDVDKMVDIDAHQQSIFKISWDDAMSSRTGGITLIDEIEHGLESHRIRRLLHVFRTGTRLLETGADNADETISSETANQFFLTTHSPIALCELEPADLRIVRSADRVTDIKQPDIDDVHFF